MMGKAWLTSRAFARTSWASSGDAPTTRVGCQADGPGHLQPAPLHLCCLVRPDHSFNERAAVTIDQLATQRDAALARQFKVGEVGSWTKMVPVGI
jgi:hypothetical protein